jgi:hypothetical protein
MTSFDRARVFLAAAAAAGVIACGGPGAFAQTAALIRPDAVLEFVAPSGKVAARLVVEIADTAEARARGLMGRMLRDDSAGMLFLFERPEPQVFWMRATPGALDIIFLDAEKRVLNIARNTTPMSDTTYASAGPAQFVVEVRAGFAGRFGLREGYTVRWRPLS